MNGTKVVAVVPAFRSKNQVLPVLRELLTVVDHVVLIDDACPEFTGAHVRRKVKSKKLTVLRNDKNLGVGGATIAGFRAAQDLGAQVIVKIDSDGQMDPQLIPFLTQPIIGGRADYVKGNRFTSFETVIGMPKLRILGNAVLSLMSKISTGYWSINDPTNGFFAISHRALDQIKLEKLRNGWFFESDMLFRLSVVRARVVDFQMSAHYGAETSNLRPHRVIWEFWSRHTINFLKRLIYQYYIREWSAPSLEMPVGIVMTIWGMSAGVHFWMSGIASNSAATTGEVMLAAVPILLGFQMLLSCLNFDITSEPREPAYPIDHEVPR